MRAFFSITMIFAGWMACASTSMAGVILAAGLFAGRVDRWDTTTNTVSTFSDIGASTGGATAIIGLAYNPVSNHVIVTDRLNNRIYELNSTTGAIVAQHTSSNLVLPAGVAVDNSGNVYVANAGGNSITRFSSDFSSETNISIPDFGVGPQNAPSGVAITASGNVLVSTALGFVGTLQYDPNSGVFSSFNATNPLANAMIATNDAGSVFIGSSNLGLGFGPSGTDVSIFDASGSFTSSIAIDSTLLPEPPLSYTSLNFTNPSGVAIDGSGNLVVGALGRTNPFSSDDNFQSNGGLFLFDPSGNLITSLVQTTPYSSVVYFSAVPEPTSLLALGVGLSAFGLARRRRTKSSGHSKVSNPS